MPTCSSSRNLKESPFAPLHSQFRGDLGGDPDVVAVSDAEFVEENPLGHPPGDRITGQRMQLCHLLVRQHQVVARPVHVPSDLSGSIAEEERCVNVDVDAQKRAVLKIPNYFIENSLNYRFTTCFPFSDTERRIHVLPKT